MALRKSEVSHDRAAGGGLKSLEPPKARARPPFILEEMPEMPKFETSIKTFPA